MMMRLSLVSEMCGREEALKVRIPSLDRKRPLAAAPFGVVVQALRGHDD